MNFTAQVKITFQIASLNIQASYFGKANLSERSPILA